MGVPIWTFNIVRAISSPSSWQIEEEKLEAVTDFIFLGCKVTADGDCSQEIKSRLLFGKKAMAKLGKSIKKQRHPFPKKCLDSQSYGFSSSHVQTWELDHKEGWVTKNWCFRTVALEKTLESPLDCKEIKTSLKLLRVKERTTFHMSIRNINSIFFHLFLLVGG